MTSLATLPFDASRRFAALLHAAQGLDLPANAAFLDVGGHPGTLARLLRGRFEGWTGLTIDTVEAPELPDYRQASGARLPLEDASVDIVFSSDTLEHVPPSDRPAFLAECARVSRDAVLIGAPFANPAVSAIEARLDAAHREATGRAHPWLGEHVEHGLPSLEETCALLAREGFEIRLGINAPLQDWMLWQWAGLVRETGGSLDDAWQRAQDAAGAWLRDGSLEEAGEFAWLPQGEAPAFLPYRWIVAGRRAGRPMPYPAMPARCAVREAHCLALNELLEGLAAGRSPSPAGGALQVALDEQGRRALELAEGEVRRLRQQQPSLLGRLLGRNPS